MRAVPAYKTPQLATIGCGAATRNQPLATCSTRAREQDCQARKIAADHTMRTHQLHREAHPKPARQLFALVVKHLHMKQAHEVVDVELIVSTLRHNISKHTNNASGTHKSGRWIIFTWLPPPFVNPTHRATGGYNVAGDRRVGS
jgi:hypothetical protein